MSKDTSMLKKFHIFPKLPLELRRRIWEETFTPQKPLEFYFDSYNVHPIKLHLKERDDFFPISLRVCRESRDEVKLHHHRLHFSQARLGDPKDTDFHVYIHKRPRGLLIDYGTDHWQTLRNDPVWRVICYFGQLSIETTSIETLTLRYLWLDEHRHSTYATPGAGFGIANEEIYARAPAVMELLFARLPLLKNVILQEYVSDAVDTSTFSSTEELTLEDFTEVSKASESFFLHGLPRISREAIPKTLQSAAEKENRDAREKRSIQITRQREVLRQREIAKQVQEYRMAEKDLGDPELTEYLECLMAIDLESD